MMNPTAVKCLACGTEFEPIITVNADNRRIINCHICGRGYRYDEKTDTWNSDRQLTILDNLTEPNKNIEYCEYSLPSKVRINDTDRLCYLNGVHIKCDCHMEDCVIRYYANKRRQKK
jgi:transcription elongation factor Elf1